MNKKVRILLISILVVFALVRIPGLPTSYYQDEFKNVVASETSLAAASEFFTHPPLTALLMRTDAVLFGGSAMRMLPLFFGVLSAVLLFIVVRRRFDERTALWSVALYTVSFYGVWASLMVDTDGAILPTLLLASVYCYDRLRAATERRLLWGGLLALALVTGLLVKLSFVLVLGALFIDFLIAHRHSVRFHQLRIIGFGFVGFGAFLAVALVMLHILNPEFQFGGMIDHARSYIHFSGRNYMQVLVQGVKAVYYLSPLLLVPLVFLSRDTLQRARVFLIYLGVGLIFYFVLFDFSRGALDKYLMFAIVPLCVLSGAVFARLPIPPFPLRRIFVGAGIFSAFLVASAAFVPQMVVPLYPKSAWFLAVLHGHLNVLTPFNGGSGPLGFYVSFLVIFFGFLVSLVAVGAGLVIPRFRQGVLVIVLLAGLSYNAVFIEEFSFGKINGSAREALSSSLAFIERSGDIERVLTYNDVGAYELSKMGKYEGRFYAAPDFEAGHRVKFAAFTGQYLVIGIPPLYDGFYSQYFSECAILFRTESGTIPGTVYTCRQTKK